jgi:hypothetical protein
LRIRNCLAGAALAGALALSHAATAQTFRPLQLPDGFYQRAAERGRPPLPPAERERVVGRASADFSGASYYNRPGGTWDDYLRDWYDCEAVTNGSRIPEGLTNYVKSPSLLSPRETGIGVTIGGAIGTGDNLYAIQEANRRACMQVRGWRHVTPDAAEGQRISALSDAAFLEWVKGAIGSPNPVGAVESSANARLPDNPAIAPDATPPGEPSLRISGGGDPHAPLALGPGEGALVLAFRRPDKGSAGQRAAIMLRRYDLARADLMAPAPGDRGTEAYSVPIQSSERDRGYELQIVRLPAGHYVVDGTSVDGSLPDKSNCFGAPLIEVPAGQAVYAGDWVPYHNVKLGKGKILPDALVLVGFPDQSRAALARFQPALAEGLKPMAVANGASYTCANPNIVLDHWSIGSVPPPPAVR